MGEIKRYKLPVAKYVSHRYEMYSGGNLGNNYVISLYGDRLTIIRLTVVIILKCLEMSNHYIV